MGAGFAGTTSSLPGSGVPLTSVELLVLTRGTKKAHQAAASDLHLSLFDSLSVPHHREHAPRLLPRRLSQCEPTVGGGGACRGVVVRARSGGRSRSLGQGEIRSERAWLTMPGTHREALLGQRAMHLGDESGRAGGTFGATRRCELRRARALRSLARGHAFGCGPDSCNSTAPRLCP